MQNDAYYKQTIYTNDLTDRCVRIDTSVYYKSKPMQNRILIRRAKYVLISPLRSEL